MRYYLIGPKQEERRAPDRFQAYLAHKWNLPGVRCTVCGATWARRGVHYPTLDLSALPNESEYRSPRAVDLEEFERLRGPLLAIMPDGSVPAPGTTFGSLVGTASGNIYDFTWPNPWTPLIRAETLSLLAAGGIELPAAGARIVYEGGSGPELFEPQILPRAYLAPGTGIRELEQCTACGRHGFSRPKDQALVLDAKSIDGSDVFRLHDLPTYIVASQRFRDLVSDKGISGLGFNEIDSV